LYLCSSLRGTSGALSHLGSPPSETSGALSHLGSSPGPEWPCSPLHLLSVEYREPLLRARCLERQVPREPGCSLDAAASDLDLCGHEQWESSRASDRKQRFASGSELWRTSEAAIRTWLFAPVNIGLSDSHPVLRSGEHWTQRFATGSERGQIRAQRFAPGSERGQIRAQRFAPGSGRGQIREQRFAHRTVDWR
jgi:hypothetical protein